MMDDFSHWIEGVFKEDVGSGDHSALACVSEDTVDQAILLVKEPGVISGVSLAYKIFQYFDPELDVQLFKHDGDCVEAGEYVLEVRGSARSILTTERTVLNAMQRLSGVATQTHNLSQLISHTTCKLLDTRKTTPGLRIYEKEAVRHGGAYNHRMGLYDMVMLKDNHIDYAGGIQIAMKRTRDYLNEMYLPLKIEIEARNRKEVIEIMDGDVPDRIMLDNFSLEDLRWAVDFIGEASETEASGGITEQTLVGVAETGVDFISVGALTHSVRSLDLSLKAKSSLA